MKYLLDSHTLLWFLNGDSAISPTVKEIISNKENLLFISIVTLWEISIKISLKKLEL